MTWHRAGNEDIILIRENLDYAERFNFHAISSHAACHTKAFENTARVRRSTHRTRCTLTIMLTVRRLTHPMEAVTFHNPLESFTFCSTNHRYFFSFRKNITCNGFTNLFIERTITNFFYNGFGSSICFCKMMKQCFRSVFLFGFAECDLQRFIAVRLKSLLLRNYARTSFNDGASRLLTIGLKHAGHADFFTNNTFHYPCILVKRPIAYKARD